MKKLFTLIAVACIASQTFSLHADEGGEREEMQRLVEMPEQSLIEQIAFADAIYAKAAESASLWDRFKARFPIIREHLEENSRAHQLAGLNKRRWQLRDALWRKRGKNSAERWARRYKDELATAAGLGVTALVVGSIYKSTQKKPVVKPERD